ncbi:hypothetical protein BS17DRAFT_766852 [Gyrodon lividus]|nr:hypothetical protein BS17DRAFT_766852 [Gyrodon lividus]
MSCGNHSRQRGQADLPPLPLKELDEFCLNERGHKLDALLWDCMRRDQMGGFVGGGLLTGQGKGSATRVHVCDQVAHCVPGNALHPDLGDLRMTQPGPGSLASMDGVEGMGWSGGCSAVAKRIAIVQGVGVMQWWDCGGSGVSIQGKGGTGHY